MTGKSISTAMFSTFLLAACQQPMNKDMSSFKVDSDILGKTETFRTSQRDAFGTTQVLSAKGDQGWFSVAKLSTHGVGVISQNAEAPRLTLKGWKQLQGKALAYGDTGKASTPNGTIAYERFSFDGNNCFHFHQLKYRAMHDAWVRYRQVVTGYACESGGKKTPDEVVSSFIGAIVVPPVDVNVYEKDVSPVTLFEPVRPVRTRLAQEPTSF